MTKKPTNRAGRKTSKATKKTSTQKASKKSPAKKSTGKKTTSKKTTSKKTTSKKSASKQARAQSSRGLFRHDFSELTKLLLEIIKHKFPHCNLLDPLPAGQVGPELPFEKEDVQRLFTAAATVGNRGSQIWVNGDNELLVQTNKIRVDLDEGLILVTIPVSCDQARDVLIEVPLAVGSKRQPAGMVVATEERPRGPAPIVDLWGESLIAFAYRILMVVTTRVAFDSGVDQDREGLIPASLTASRDGLRVLTMARHAFDRVIK